MCAIARSRRDFTHENKDEAVKLVVTTDRAVATVARELGINDAEACLVPMESIGLRLRVREHGHRMLRTAELDFHVHVLPPATAEQIDYLDLRDWLRVSAADRALCESTKRTLAAITWSDTNHYADAKSAVIQQIRTNARAWRAVCFTFDFVTVEIGGSCRPRPLAVSFQHVIRETL